MGTISSYIDNELDKSKGFQKTVDITDIINYVSEDMSPTSFDMLSKKIKEEIKGVSPLPSKEFWKLHNKVMQQVEKAMSGSTKVDTVFTFVDKLFNEVNTLQKKGSRELNKIPSIPKIPKIPSMAKMAKMNKGFLSDKESKYLAEKLWPDDYDNDKDGDNIMYSESENHYDHPPKNILENEEKVLELTEDEKISALPVDLYLKTIDVPCLFETNISKEATHIINDVLEKFPNFSAFDPTLIKVLANRLFPKDMSMIISWGYHALRQQQKSYRQTFDLVNKFHAIDGQKILDSIISKANNKNTKTSFLSSWFSPSSKIDDVDRVDSIKSKLEEIIAPVELCYTNIKRSTIPLWMSILMSYSEYIQELPEYKDDIAYLSAVNNRRTLLYDVAKQTEIVEKQLSQIRVMIVELKGKVDNIENVVLPNMFMASKEAEM